MADPVPSAADVDICTAKQMNVARVINKTRPRTVSANGRKAKEVIQVMNSSASRHLKVDQLWPKMRSCAAKLGKHG